MKAMARAPARVLYALAVVVVAVVMVPLVPGPRVLAAPQAVWLNGDSNTGMPTSAKAIAYANGLSLAYAGGSTMWQSVTVLNAATHAAAAYCPGKNCTVTAWTGPYVRSATITGLKPGETYSVSIFERDQVRQNNVEYEDLAPNLTTQASVGQLTLSGPPSYPPRDPYQVALTLHSDTAEPSLVWTVRQQRLGSNGSVVPFTTCPLGATLSGGDCLYRLSVTAGGSATMTTANQAYGGPGYVYRYTATAASYATNVVLFANAPTFYVHRRTRGLFVTWPDEGNGAEYEIFGGPGSGGCSRPTFHAALMAGATQLAIGGLTPNTQYAVCMWAEIPGQPVTPGGWMPTWWVAGGNANGTGKWYTLPDVPGSAAAGGLLAAYYDVPALGAGAGGPSARIFADNGNYTAVQGPIDFTASCNCGSSWPYTGHGGPMPASAGGRGSAQAFGAKFLGWLRAPASGTYRLGCRADDACQVWVNGTIVADGMTSGGAAPNYFAACNACDGVTGSIALTAGTWYPLEVDYTQGVGGASVDFYWTPPGDAQADVPAADLAYPVPVGAPAGGQGNATISWSSNGNPAGSTYELQRYVLSPAGGIRGSSLLYQGTASSFTTTDLGPGEVTEYYVRAVSGDGLWTPYATEPGGGGYLYADAPVPGVATPSSTSQLGVTWPALGNGAHYAVLWSTQPDFGTFRDSGDLGRGASSYTVADLTPNTMYFVALEAWVPEASGAGSQVCPGAVNGCGWTTAIGGGRWTLADPPTSLRVSGSGSAVTLSWDGGGNPPSTAYQWSVAAEGSSSAATAGQTTSLQAVAAGLSCQTGYIGAVHAVNGAGVATSPVTVAAETGICPPAPQVGLSIDDGLGQTSTASVTLDITAADINYAQSQLAMRFSNGRAWSSWRPYAATASWSIGGRAGPNTVYVQVKDPDGGVGSATASITYDSSLSTVAAAAGTACTYLHLSALCVRSPVISASFTMPNGSVSMEISFDNTNWSPPQDAAATVDLVLPAGDGLKAVFARYFNTQDVATAAGPDYFVLDTMPPSIRTSWLDGAAVTAAGSATLVVQASDGAMPANSLRVAVAGAASYAGPLPANGEIPLKLTGSGFVSVTVTVTDPAGNAATATAGIYNY